MPQTIRLRTFRCVYLKSSAKIVHDDNNLLPEELGVRTFPRRTSYSHMYLGNRPGVVGLLSQILQELILQKLAPKTSGVGAL